MADKKTITAEEIKKNFKLARLADSKWMKEAREDLKFRLGEQWTDEEKETLREQGRPAMTFNIIQPIILLASGYQRQSRSAIRAFPNGGEDAVKSEVATALIKHACNKSKLENKMSLQFEAGIEIGKGFLEPYIDYTEDLVYGRLQWRFRNPFAVKFDPNCTEYDLSDCEYMIYEDYFTKSKLGRMFPQHKSKILQIQVAKEPLEEEYPAIGDLGELGIKKTSESSEGTYDNVYGMDEEAPEDSEELGEEVLHYIEHQYKKYITKYLAADATRGKMQLFDDKDKAQEYLDQLRAQDPISPEVIVNLQLQDPTFTGEEKQKVIERVYPEIWVAIMVEDEVIEDMQSSHYPQWKGFSLLPYFSHYSPLARMALQRNDLAYQGIVRSLKDPQREKNKRRSQMLHHLNTSANSGWLSVQGAWVDPDKVETLGSTAGVQLEYKKGVEKPERIAPVSLSQGHLIMEEAAEQDIKTISGINADMLAMDDKTTSGRAIALRQNQGFLMLKRIFDNFSWTQEIVGRYILTQLGKLYSVETAMLVLGAEFIVKNKVTPQIVDEVLNSADLGDYDVTIGEGQDSPTMRYSNYMLLSELMEKGAPIPFDVLLEYSDLPDAAKKSVIASIQRQQALQPPGVAA